MKNRLIALFLSVVLVFSMLPASFAFAEEADPQLMLALKATKISVDNILDEQEWAATAAFTGALSGSLSAAWDKENLYLGIGAANATDTTVSLGQKTITAQLVNGVAEIIVPWEEIGVALYDYNQIVSGLSASLVGDAGTSSLTADLVISGMTANDIDLSGFSAIASGVTKSADKVVWDTAATQQQDRIYKANMPLIDHSKDMLLTHTVRIDKLPARTGVINSNAHYADGCYFFWISDYNDNGRNGDDTIANDNGTAIFCVVYADADGNLYLRISSDASQDTVENAGVALDRKLGETFQLSVLWRADDSAAVYVDGETVLEVEDGTHEHNSGLGNKAMMFWYYNAQKTVDATAKFTISDVTLSVSGEKSELSKLTAASVFGNVDLQNVTADLQLPDTWESEDFGLIPLTWTSSDETVLTSKGKVTRPAGLVAKTVQLTLSVEKKTLWTVDITVVPGEASTKINAVCADEIIVDGNLNEIFWTNYVTMPRTTNDSPYGSVALAYNKNGLYVGVKYTNATALTVNLNGKTFTKDFGSFGEAEMLLPWEECGVALTDYYQEVPGFQLTLESVDGVTTMIDGAANLVLTSQKVNPVQPSAMTKHGNTAEISASEDAIIWNTTTVGHSKVYRQNYGFINHSMDMILTQTICIESMPVSSGVIHTTGDFANDTYYFWMCDYNDRGTDDQIANNSGTALFGVVYADADGNLYLRIRGNSDDDALENAGVPIGKQIGETFQLSILWKPDDSAVAYVDGQFLVSVEDATLERTSGLGAKCLQFLYKNSVTRLDAAQLTVSNISVICAEANSVKEEITKEAVLNGTDLTKVIDNLDLPEYFVSPYLGKIQLRWESSDETILGSDGTVYPPDNDEGATVQLTLYVGDTELWTVDVVVAPATAEVVGPFPASPSVITAAFSADEIRVDGTVDEHGWVLSTRVLDSNNMLRGKFGVQWQKNTLFLAVKARMIEEATLVINGKKVQIDWETLTVTGDFTVDEIAKKNAVVELAIPFAQLGITVDRYDIRVPITVELGSYTYSGVINLDSVDWFVADNEYRPLPASTKGTVKYLGGSPVAGYQGYEQITDGWRVYDLYNPDGENPVGVRTYVIMIKDEEFEPLADRNSTIYVEFDFLAESMPVYDAAEDAGWAGNFASYGFTWWLADDDDAAKNANSVSFGIINTDEGLTFVALRENGSVWHYVLNKNLGDLFRIGTGWKPNGDVVLYVDGMEIATIEGVESLRNGFGDKSLAFNLIRNLDAAASEMDNFDIYFTNIAAGHAMENSLLEALTWEKICGNNSDFRNVVSALTLPDKIDDSQLGISQGITWTSSNPDVLQTNGSITRPDTGAVEVSLTATLTDGTTKTFNLRIMGVSNSSGNVLVLNKDYNPANGIGTVIEAYDFTLDTDNSSVIIDLQEKQNVSVVKLTDGDKFARLNEEVLTLWVSDDNVTYSRIKDFKLLHNGENWYLYDFKAVARYVKVHCTHFDGDEADFIGPVAIMITAYDDPYLSNSGVFAESNVSLTNDTGIERYDYAFTFEGEVQRVILNGEILYHYTENGKTIVRIPYIAKNETVVLNVLYGNDVALDISNKEFVYEITYGTREMHDVGGNPRWVITLPDGALMGFTEGGKTLYRGFSYDNGYTWTNFEAIPCTAGLFSETSGFTVDSHTGRIFVHGHLVGGFNATDMEKSNAVINMIYSDDFGKTWTYLGQIDTDGTYSVTYTNGLELSCYDGEGPNVDFLFPTGQQYNNDGSFCARVIYTTDAGSTWQTSESKIIYEEAAAFEGGVSECTIMERDDGVLVLLGRNQGPQHVNFARSYSYDHGITWVVPAELSDVYTVNTQPIMFKYDEAILLTWGGNNMLGGESRIRTPYNIAITYDQMGSFENIQDIYVKYSLQGLTASTMNRITNQSVAVTENDTFITTWMNLTRANTERSEVLMRVEDFHNFFYRTKGAFDSFEHGTVKYEGWEATGGDAVISGDCSTDGSYSMKLIGAVVARSVPYIQNGTVSMDIWVDWTSDFSVELQSAYTNVSGKGAPVGFKVNGFDITFLGAEEVSGLTLKEGWNTVTIELKLDDGDPSANFSVNGSTTKTMPVNTQIGDYVCFVTVMNSGTLYVDNFLLVDDQDAIIYEQTEAGAVMQKIASIGTVTLDSAERIASAREAYEALTEEQKTQVSNYDVLVAAEAALKALQEALPKISGNLSLNDTIDINYIIPATVDMTDAVLVVKNAATGEAVEYTVLPGTAGTTIVRFSAKANHMTDEITVQVVDADGNPLTQKASMSVRKYAGIRFASAAETEKMMLIRMLDYGALAQISSGVTTDLANSIVTDELRSFADGYAWAEPTGSNELPAGSGGIFKAALALNETIDVTVYTAASNVADGGKIVVKCNGEELAEEDYIVRLLDDGRYAIRYSVKSDEMSDEIGIAIVDANNEVTYETTLGVRIYAQKYLAAVSNDINAVMIIAMLDYGAMAQIYANTNTDDLANNFVTAAMRQVLIDYAWPEN